jgi:hypothetical protein
VESRLNAALNAVTASNSKPRIDMTQTTSATNAKGESRMWWGLGLDTWNNLIVGFLAAGAACAVAGGWATYVAFQLQKQEAEAASASLERYKADAGIAISAANERAKAAELETQKIKERMAPRFMKREAFLKALEGQPKGRVEILYLRDDPECMEVAQNIGQLLEIAGWEVLSREPLKARDERPNAAKGPSMMTVGGQPSGITVVAGFTSPEEQEAGVNRMLGKPWARTPFTVLEHAISEGIGRVSTASGGQYGVRAGMLRITVAPKGTAG